MATKAVKAATKRTRQVPADKIPAELIGMYDGERDEEEVSTNFTTTRQKADPGELETLFTVDGVAYTIPKKFGPGVGLIYLDVVQESRDVALAGVLKHVIGADGWKALMSISDQVTAEQLKKIIGTVQEKLFAAMEENGEGN